MVEFTIEDEITHTLTLKLQFLRIAQKCVLFGKSTLWVDETLSAIIFRRFDIKRLLFMHSTYYLLDSGRKSAGKRPGGLAALNTTQYLSSPPIFFAVECVCKISLNHCSTALLQQQWLKGFVENWGRIVSFDNFLGIHHFFRLFLYQLG